MLPRHVMNMLWVLLAVLVTGCSSQEIEVDLSDNTNRSVTIPRVSSLLITVPNSYECSQDTTSDGNKCRYNVPDTPYPLNFTRANTPPLVLTITVNDDRKVACKQYIFNTSQQQQPLNFTCIPVVTSNNPVDVADAVIRWRRFINSSQMDQFISDNTDPSGLSILNNTSPGDIIIETTGMVTNSSIEIRSTDVQYRVGFYLPTVLLMSGEEEHTQPFAIYLDPAITSSYEFSFIELIDTVNFDQIRCAVDSFPQATVSWKRDNEPLPSHIELTSLNNITDQVTLEFAINATLVFDTVQYSDAGLYQCTARNEYSEVNSSLAVRLRVHSRLRPLWPAIGLIAVMIITPLFIIGGHFFDKLWAKVDSSEKDGLVGSGEKRSYSVSDSDSPNNTEGHHYHKAIRRVSSARQELLTESSQPV